MKIRVSDTKINTISQELSRLRKLENAVRNYSGGIFNLHDRVNSVLSSPHPHLGEIDKLLNDLSVYLRDLKVAGNIRPDF